VLVTVPEPVPGRVTVTSAVAAKLIAVVTGAVMLLRVHVGPCPAQAPLQLTNWDPPFAVAMSVAEPPELIADELVHVPEVAPAVDVQLMPTVLVTVPVPLPAPVTVTVVALNVAVTD